MTTTNKFEPVDLDDYNLDPGFTCTDGDLDGRYLLVERSNVTGLEWVTCWDTPQDAAEYHDNSNAEYGDWTIHTLTDRATGDDVPTATRTEII